MTSGTHLAPPILTVYMKHESRKEANNEVYTIKSLFRDPKDKNKPQALQQNIDYMREFQNSLKKKTVTR